MFIVSIVHIYHADLIRLRYEHGANFGLLELRRNSLHQKVRLLSLTQNEHGHWRSTLLPGKQKQPQKEEIKKRGPHKTGHTDGN